MSCDFEALEAYALGELSLDRANAVAAHAQRCPACGQELRLLRLERSALSARARMLEEPLPPFAAVLERSLQPESPQVATLPHRALRLPAWAGLAAAAVLLAVTNLPRHVTSPTSPASPAECISWSSPPASLPAGWEDDAIATEEHAYAACLVATPGQDNEPNACL